LKFTIKLKAHYLVLKPFLQLIKKGLCYLAIGLIIHWITLKLANYYFNELHLGKDIFIADPGQADSDLISGRSVDIFVYSYGAAIFTEILVVMLAYGCYRAFTNIKQIKKCLITPFEKYHKEYRKALERINQRSFQKFE